MSTSHPLGAIDLTSIDPAELPVLESTIEAMRRDIELLEARRVQILIRKATLEGNGRARVA